MPYLKPLRLSIRRNLSLHLLIQSNIVPPISRDGSVHIVFPLINPVLPCQHSEAHSIISVALRAARMSNRSWIQGERRRILQLPPSHTFWIMRADVFQPRKCSYLISIGVRLTVLKNEKVCWKKTQSGRPKQCQEKTNFSEKGQKGTHHNLDLNLSLSRLSVA